MTDFRLWLQADIQSLEIEVCSTPNNGHSASMTGFGPIWSDLGPGADGAGLPRACAPLLAPGALAWMVRTALRAKTDPLEGRSRFACERVSKFPAPGPCRPAARVSGSPGAWVFFVGKRDIVQFGDAGVGHDASERFQVAGRFKVDGVRFVRH